MKNRKYDIEKYLRGELSPAEMHALEKEALDDPFLAEALEGLEQAGGADNFLQDLHRLNRKVHDRARHRKDKTIKIWGWTAGMAAAVLLVAVSGFLVISLLKDQAAQQLAMKEEPIPLPGTEDSLTVVLPPKEARQAARADRVQPAAREVEPDARVRPQSDNEKPTETGGFIAELNASQKQDEAETGVAEIQTKEEQEPSKAEAPAEETKVVSDAEAADDQRSKKLEGRVAGVQSRESAPSVTRSLSTDVVLLTGKVTSATDGEGLPGVNVILKGTSVATVTDVEGNYQLPVPAKASDVVFAFIGFEPHEVTVENRKELNVALEEDVTALSEVVVTGYGEANTSDDKAETFSPAAPSGGKNDFREYLERSLVYPQEALLKKVEGRVTVRFAVQPDGQLTDFEVVKGIGHGCDEELIRAIKAGPSWEPAARGGVALRDKVKVRYKFELPK